MINGIKPIVGNTTKTQKVNGKNGLSFDEAMDNLLVKIQENYDKWGGGMDKKLDLELRPGRKFIKVVEGSIVWGFIANCDGTHKGIPHKKGDVFKAAGWRAPAKWSRGSIFSNDKFYTWTGPKYLI